MKERTSLASANLTAIEKLYKKYYHERYLDEQFEKRFEVFVKETKREFGQYEENEFGPECP